MRLLWEGSVCPSAWECSFSMGFAAHTFFTDPEPDEHINDVDTIFDLEEAWTFNDSECSTTDPEGPYGAPGDFGPWVGDKNSNGTWDSAETNSSGDLDHEADQFTVAFHEFAHWIHLDDWDWKREGLSFAAANTVEVVPNNDFRECWTNDGHRRTAEGVNAHDETNVVDLYTDSNTHGHNLP